MNRTRPLIIALLCAGVGLSACNGCGEPENNANGGDPNSMPEPGEDMDEAPEDMDEEPPEQDMDGAEQDMDDEPDLGPGDTDMPAAMDMGDGEETLQIPQLSAPVQVRLDAQGVLHLECQTNEDCFAAEGYYHAAHRFAQMDLRRRLGRGRVSSLLAIGNEGAYNLDVATRRLLTTASGEPLEEAIYDALDPETRGYADAYARGVNAWLADLRAERNGAQLSEEYDFALIRGNPDEIPDWEPQDSLAVGLLFLNSLIDASGREAAAAEDLTIFGAEAAGLALFQDIYQGWHLDPDSSIMTASGETYDMLGASSALRPAPQRPNFAALRQRLGPAQGLFEQARADLENIAQWRGEGPFGSNSWATGPAVNAGDAAILSNDPHLSLTNPATWYLAQMDAKTNGQGDFHAAGVTFPGLPGIMIGYSEDVAWSATVANWDLLDLYVEEMTEDGSGVAFNDQDVAFTEQDFTFAFGNGERTETIQFVPHHGPVIAMDEDAGRALTVRSVLSRPEDVAGDFRLFLSMGRQSSLADAKTLLSGSTAAGFNFTLIDRQGSIAYYPFAGIPRREWDAVETPAWLPLPGNGDYEWGEDLIRADELPQMLNPSTNFIVTANAAITDDMLDGIPGNAGYPPLQEIFIAPGARQGRILDMIEKNDGHTMTSHFEIQGDTMSWLAQEMLPAMQDVPQDQTLSAEARAVRDALDGWSMTCPTGLASEDPEGDKAADADEAAASIGCSAFHVLLFTLGSQAFDDELIALGEDNRTASYEVRALYWLLLDSERLNGGDNYWDDVSTADAVETRGEILARAYEQTATNLESLFGSSTPDDWRWGRIHTVTFAADLLSTITENYDNGPYAAPGGLYTANVANPRRPGRGNRDYSFEAGASMRMVVEGQADGFIGHFQLPGGQIHRRDSALYDHLIDEWLVNGYFQMPFTAAQVEAAAQQTFTIEPAE